MIIVPVNRAQAGTLYTGVNEKVGGSLFYFYIRYDKECFGVMSDEVVDLSYWAWEHNWKTRQSYWVESYYESDDVIKHVALDKFWIDPYAWVGGTLVGGELSKDPKYSKRDWVDTAISALISGNVNKWRTLLRYFGRGGVIPTLNRVGGIILPGASYFLHDIIVGKYFPCSLGVFRYVD